MLTLCFLVFFTFREIKPPHVFFVKILRGEGVLHVVQHDVGSSLTVQQRRTLRPLALPRRFRAWLVAQHDVGRSFFTAQQRRPLHPLALEPKTNEWGVLSFLRCSSDDRLNHLALPASEENFHCTGQGEGPMIAANIHGAA